jgi:hypothetical protein
MLVLSVSKWFLFMLSALPLASAPPGDEAARILTTQCKSCHDGSLRPAFDLTSPQVRATMLKAIHGGGPGVKAMPPGRKLKPEHLASLSAWIERGAPLPGPHWAFTPLAPLTPGQSIDSLIDANLHARGIPAAPPAGSRTLLRRLSFDLTGLPPKTKPPASFSTYIDQLLSSPHFGEHWGRHWLDVARYGEDDYSGTAVQPYPQAWRFRDWVVNSFNRNLPYNTFLMAQIAGDLMNDPSLAGGTGLFGLGPWYYGISQPPQARADERHDRIDMVSRGMLGVTLACARCHDHKYDPFTQKDYYALSGVFSSSAYKEYPLVPETEAASWRTRKKALDDAEKALNTFLTNQAVRLRAEYAPGLSRYMMATLNADPAGLNLELFNRWCEYLRRPEDLHPYLKDWFAAPSLAHAQAFERLLLTIDQEKKALDEENRQIIAAAEKAALKPKRTIVLPGGYRSEEDFNPNAGVAIKSLPRDRFVAWNRTFSEGAAPLRFPPDLTVKFLTGPHKDEYNRLLATRDRLKKELGPKFPYFDGISEFDPHDLPVDLRGNPENTGDIVPRRFPLALSNNLPIPFNEGSGRLALARTIAHHPLAARVAVNRIWMHLFGAPIVRTPSNFGLAGERPSHPELLEYLAARFAASGYDTKALIREIVSSRAYQRSASGDSTKDPANLYFARQSRKRLPAEPLRDAMLAASGRLDLRTGGESEELTPNMRRRTLYARIGRFEANETLALFDAPNAAVTCEQRVVTNVPLQKLFYLNSDLVSTESRALGEFLRRHGLDKTYQRLFQRKPTPTEKQAARDFLRSGGAHAQLAQVLLSTNEFAYVD